MWLATAGFTCFVLCDAVIKAVGSSALPAYQIVGFLGLFTALVLAACTAWQSSWRVLWPRSPKQLLVRSTLELGNNVFVVVALRHLSLTLFYILVFTSPLLVSMMGRVFLRETLGWRRLCAILIGFLGVLIAVFPLRHSGGSAWTGVAACVVCVACFSTAMVWSRVLVQTERSETIAFFSGIVSAGVGLVGLLLHAAPMSAGLVAAFALMGLLGAVGSICIFTALQHTSVATVSQFHYTQLVSGAAVSYLVFHEAPTRWMVVGAALILAAGLYVATQVPRQGAGTEQADVEPSLPGSMREKP